MNYHYLILHSLHELELGSCPSFKRSRCFIVFLYISKHGLSRHRILCIAKQTHVQIHLITVETLSAFPFQIFRVFPTRRRSEVETLLQKYRGDVVQAMEAMLSGDDGIHSITVPTASPPFSVKSAFSPLVPPGVFSSAASRYALFQQQHTKRFLAAPYSGTGYLSTVIQSEAEQNESNGNGDRCGSAGEAQE